MSAFAFLFAFAVVVALLAGGVALGSGHATAAARAPLAGDTFPGHPRSLRPAGPAVSANWTDCLLTGARLPGDASCPSSSGPSAIAWDSLNGQVYVANQDSGTVSVINVTTDQMVGIIPVGDYPDAVAVDDATGQIFVADYMSGNITVINGTDDTVVASIPVGYWLTSEAFDPANGEIFVASAYDSNLTAINGSTDLVLNSTLVGESPQGIAYDSTNGELYITDNGANAVSVVNGSSNRVIQTFSTNFYDSNPGPWAIAFDSANNYLYVADEYVNAVQFIDASTNSPTGLAYDAIGSSGDAIAVDPSSGYVFVGGGSDQVGIISTATGTLVKSEWIGGGASGMVFDSLDGLVYASDSNYDDIALFNGTTGNASGSVPAGLYPGDVAYDSWNGRVFVANGVANNVTVIAGGTGIILGSIFMGTNSSTNALAFDQANGLLYVAEGASENVTVIDGATDSIVGSIPVPVHPGALAYDPANGYIYVASEVSNNVTVIDGSSNVVAGSIPVRTYSNGLVYDSSDDDIYAATPVTGGLTVINGSNDQVAGTISTNSGGYGLAYDSANGDIYIADGPESYGVTVVNASSSQVVESVQVGVGIFPVGVTYDPANGFVYVEGYNCSFVSVIDGSTNQIAGNISVPWGPVAGAYDASNGYVYVASAQSGAVSIITGSPPPAVFNVTLTETGLPLGTSWAGSIDGVRETSTTAILTFVEPNGTYLFEPGLVPGWTTMASGQTISVNGSAVNQSVAWNRVDYQVSFNETGLPSGTTWSITLNGSQRASDSATIYFSDPNGSYSYSVGQVLSFQSTETLSSPLGVEGKSVAVAVEFSPALSVNYSVGAGYTGTCQPLTEIVNLTGSVVGGVGPYNFTWSFGPGAPLAHGASVQHTFGAAGGNVTLWVVDALGDNRSIARAVGPATVIGCPAPLASPPVDTYVVVGAVVFVVAVLAVFLLYRRGKGPATPAAAANEP
jgi:YVTN family beta-propeller protein